MIEQKAREIAEGVIATRITPLIGKDYKDRIPQLKQRIAAMRSGTGDNLPEVEAARLGIIEGLEMALATSQEVIDDMRCSDETDLRTAKFRVATAIRALIEECKG